MTDITWLTSRDWHHVTDITWLTSRDHSCFVFVNTRIRRELRSIRKLVRKIIALLVALLRHNKCVDVPRRKQIKIRWHEIAKFRKVSCFSFTDWIVAALQTQKREVGSFYCCSFVSWPGTARCTTTTVSTTRKRWPISSSFERTTTLASLKRYPWLTGSFIFRKLRSLTITRLI